MERSPGALQAVQPVLRGPRTWEGVQLWTSAFIPSELPGEHTSERQLRRGVPASLVVSNKSQDLAEAGHGQQTAVLCICDLPYLAQDGRGQLCALEKLDGDLACYDAELLCVSLLEEVLEHALLFGCQVEDGLVYTRLAVVMAVSRLWVNALSSPLPVRSAMTAQCAGCQTVKLVDGERAPAMRLKLSGVLAAGGEASTGNARRQKWGGWRQQHDTADTRYCTDGRAVRGEESDWEAD